MTFDLNPRECALLMSAIEDALELWGKFADDARAVAIIGEYKSLQSKLVAFDVGVRI